MYGKILAADTPMLERTVTLSIKNERIDVALKKIAEQGGFTFSYNPAIFDSKKQVTVNFSNTPIREVLDEIFDGSIDYKERRKYVILTKAKKTTASVVSGYVTDQNTGDRLRNVTIYDPVSLSSAITDDYGYFKIKIAKPTPNLNLVVNKVDYTDTLVVVSAARRLLKITISNSKKKISTVSDSVKVKWKRFWDKRILSPEEVNMTNVNDTIYRSMQISVLPFIGTNHKLSGNVINDYSFNIYGGYALGVRRLEMAGTFNIERGDISGAQFAGAFNGVYGKSRALQMAGLINANHDSTMAPQFAGLINLNWNSAEPFSAAGLLNVTHHQSKGVMLAGLGNATLGEQHGPHVAGLFNFSTKDTGPLQLAGLLNFTTGKMKGVQTAGLLNFGSKDLRGVQIGGLLNFVADTLVGAQVSGLINYATHIKGVQLGIINVADSIHGVPIGLLSFVLKGYHKIEISADEIFYTNLSFRTGVHQFYNIFTAGIKPEDSKDPYWTFGYGVGTAPRLTKWLSLNVDLTANQVNKGNFTDAINIINKAYVGFEVQPTKKFAIAFGVTLNAYITDTTYDNYSPLFTDYNPKIISDHTYEKNDLNMKMWLGGKVGLRFL